MSASATSAAAGGPQVTGRGTARVELRLDRPGARNALDPALIAALREALRELRADAHARLLVLCGNGPDFCAGVDLAWMRELAELPPGEIAERSRPLQQLLLEIEAMPLPVVARVQGRALAGGVGLAAACDVVVAERAAQFAISEARLGLVPALIAPTLLRRIGRRALSALALTGMPASAERMREVGLVDHVAADGDAAARLVEEVAAGILKASPDALRMCKAMLAELDGLPVAQAAGESLAWVARSRGAACARAGVAAFLEKRPPDWAAA